MLGFREDGPSAQSHAAGRHDFDGHGRACPSLALAAHGNPEPLLMLLLLLLLLLRLLLQQALLQLGELLSRDAADVLVAPVLLQEFASVFVQTSEAELEAG